MLYFFISCTMWIVGANADDRKAGGFNYLWTIVISIIEARIITRGIEDTVVAYKLYVIEWEGWWRVDWIKGFGNHCVS